MLHGARQGAARQHTTDDVWATHVPGKHWSAHSLHSERTHCAKRYGVWRCCTNSEVMPKTNDPMAAEAFCLALQACATLLTMSQCGSEARVDQAGLLFLQNAVPGTGNGGWKILGYCFLATKKEAACLGLDCNGVLHNYFCVVFVLST